MNKFYFFLYCLQFVHSMQVTTQSSSDVESRASTPCSTVFKSSTPKQTKMKQFVDKMNPAESEKIDMALAEFFFGCNIPLHTVQSEYFKAFVRTLRPSYSVPTRRKLSDALLDKEHAKITRRNQEMVVKMDKQASLLIDGWQNSSANRHNLVCMLATAEDHKILLESYDISEIGETSEQMVQLVKKAVIFAKEKYDCDVYCVVSDNAPNMTCTGRQLQPELMYTTCNSHTGNLLAKDVIGIKKYDAVMTKVMKVQKEFRKPGLASKLTKAGGKKPVLFSAIRFASMRNMNESFVHNLPIMKKICAEEDTDETDADDSTKRPDSSVVKLLFNSEFIDSVKHLLSLLDPIAKLINVCQKSEASVADAVEEWIDLLAEAPNELKVVIEKRIKKSNVFNDYTLSANYFHPIYRGQKLNATQRKQVDDYIFGVLDGNGLESSRLFNSEEGTFSSLKRKGITSPKTYWYFAQKQGHTDLATLATKLMKIPASTCQLERLFSNWGFVHSDNRNRLSPERSKMLTNIYFTLRSTDTIDEEEDDDNDEIECA